MRWRFHLKGRTMHASEDHPQVRFYEAICSEVGVWIPATGAELTSRETVDFRSRLKKDRNTNRSCTENRELSKGHTFLRSTESEASGVRNKAAGGPLGEAIA
jgi:hypothetical protein